MTTTSLDAALAKLRRELVKLPTAEALAIMQDETRRIAEVHHIQVKADGLAEFKRVCNADVTFERKCDWIRAFAKHNPWFFQTTEFMDFAKANSRQVLATPIRRK